MSTPLAAIANGRLAVHRFRWNQLRRIPKQSKLGFPAEPAPATAQLPPTTLPNPFLPHFNPASRRWAAPKLSLRQQAQLVKRARAAGLLHLLPPGPKAGVDELFASNQRANASTASDPFPQGPSIEWLSNHLPPPPSQNTSAVPSLFLAKKRLFKGHKWQRAQAKRKAQLAVRARDMDRRIHRWRMNRVRYLKSPIAATKPSTSGTKLPF